MVVRSIHLHAQPSFSQIPGLLGFGIPFSLCCLQESSIKFKGMWGKTRATIPQHSVKRFQFEDSALVNAYII